MLFSSQTPAAVECLAPILETSTPGMRNAFGSGQESQWKDRAESAETAQQFESIVRGMTDGSAIKSLRGQIEGQGKVFVRQVRDIIARLRTCLTNTFPCPSI